MRVGIDGRELCGRATGVGRYLSGLLQWWSLDAAALAHRFILYVPEPVTSAPASALFETRVVPGKGGTMWEQGELAAAARADHLDVFFAPAYTAPLTLDLPLVLVIHDVSFVAHPEWFAWREGMRRRWIARNAASRAQSIVTVSRFSKSEIITHLGIQDARIHVIPWGITPPVSPSALPRDRSRLLYVGSIFNRRHVPELLYAFKRLARTHEDVTLDLVGDNRTYPHVDIGGLIRHLDLTGRVQWHQYLGDKDLAALYGQAQGFAFLSEYEGLGMTPLEGLAAGVPPVLLNTPVARESCGDAALYVTLEDVDAIVGAFEQLLFDEPTRQALLAAAPAVLRRHEWPAAARATLDLILSHA
jgi:glycosyltransferase involved in cell wall biosynthesis